MVDMPLNQIRMVLLVRDPSTSQIDLRKLFVLDVKNCIKNSYLKL